MFSSSKTTLPPEDFKFPAIKLNKVVLPDPFGPIIPVIVPVSYTHLTLPTSRAV